MSSQRSVAASMVSGRNIADDSGRILTAKYLQRASSKKDLAKRLRIILRFLREDENVEPDNPQNYPGLAALCQSLTKLVDHRDKEIRLYTVAACMELFTIYAPEAPWNELETLDIFKQTIRQLANLGHSIRASSGNSSGQTNPSTNNVHFYQYYRILELLAEVKIAVLLVDLSKKNDDHDHDHDHESSSCSNNHCDDNEDDESSEDPSTTSDESPRRRSKRRHSGSSKSKSSTIAKKTKHKIKNNINKEALSVLSELFRTLLQSVRNEHPPEIFDFCQKTLTSCVEEFFESTIIPVPILDELLVCIGQGPRVLVLQQQHAPQSEESHRTGARSRKGRKRTASDRSNLNAPAVITVQQNNPSYMVASAVVRASVDRLSTPIASLLNGLVNSDPRSIGQSTISNHVCENSSSSSKDGNCNDCGISDEVLDMVHNLGKAQRQQQDVHGTSNVYSVILELQKVAPAILTTVFGNLASHVGTPDAAQHMLVLQTLGKLFAGNHGGGGINAKSGEKTSGNLKVAYQYSPCFRKWLQRSGHRRLDIRRIMFPHLLALIGFGCHFLNGTASSNESSSPHAELARDVQEALIQRLTSEPSAKFRTEIVQGLCTLSYRHRKILSRRVMDQLGERVMSKDKSERKDALTGLVQLHFRQYTRHHLFTVLEGGDDCPIESVLKVLEDCCPPSSSNPADTGLTSLILARSKASSSFSSTAIALGSPRKASKSKSRGRKGSQRSTRRRNDDDSDAEEGDRDEEPFGSRGVSHHDLGTDDYSYFQWIPCVLFESACYADATDSDMHSRVIQLVDELLLGCSSPHPENRRQLTSTGRATGLVIIADAIRNQSPLAWHWVARLQSVRARLQKSLRAYLDARAQIRNFPAGSEEYFSADANAKDLLEKVASMIPQPSGPSPALGERHAVLEKFHFIKDKHIFRILGTITNPNHSAKARARALDDLPKRVKATAGDAVSAWVKSLAKRCAMGDFINQDVIHHCVLLAQECFLEGELNATLKFLVCIQLAVNSFPSLCASDEVFDNLRELFRDCNGSSSRKLETDETSIITVLSAILASASPHRDTVTDSNELDGELHKKLVYLCQNGTPEQARHAVATMVSLLKPDDSEVLTQEQTDTFLPLLQTLATPSRLSIASTGPSTKLVCVLVALAELAEHAPKIFESSSRGVKALKFALEMVLMGRADVTSNSDDEKTIYDSDDEMEETKTPRGGRTGRKSSGAMSHRSPSAGGQSSAEDENLSVSCRTLYAAMEFLSVFIRSSVFTAKKTRSIILQPTLEIISQVFHIFSQILRDQGFPPSSRDRKSCSLRQDRAALRQCAAVHLFRLCDTRLGLDQKHLTTERWQCLASSLLDDERIVRKAAMEELGLMLTGHGKFAATLGMATMAPRLRFVAMSVFCVDGSQASHSVANGNAANIGKMINDQKGNIAGCIAHLRKVFESASAQCRAQGPEAEKQFETLTKLTVMPEYAVPYALHLLSYRHETPSSLASGRGKEGKAINKEDYEIDESGQKVLRKRLKALYDPLVLQLGASADNISFLLRMAEMLAKFFEPIGGTLVSFGSVYGKKEQDKLSNICATAREVLLSYVKTDANLDTHPGAIRMPSNLFRRKEFRKKSADASSSLKDSAPLPKMTKETGKDVVDEENIGERANNKRPSKLSNLVDRQNSKATVSNDRRSQNEGKISKRVTRRSTRTSIDHDVRDATLSRESNRNDDTTNTVIEGHNDKRKLLRRSTRSTRSTIFDDQNKTKMSDGTDTEYDHISTENENGESNESSIGLTNRVDSLRDDVLNLQEGTETPSNARRSEYSNKRRRSEVSRGSLANSRVHFSPEVDFGGLSPIDRRNSRDYRIDQDLLSSLETKTKGTTPPSTLRDMRFTTTASVTATSAQLHDTRDSESPTTVSESTYNHSFGASSTVRHSKLKPFGDKKIEVEKFRPKRATQNIAAFDKENTNVSVATKKKQIPKQIKIVRSKASPKNKMAKVAKKKRARAVNRSRHKKSNHIDSFEFEG